MRIALNATCFNNIHSGAKNRFTGIYSHLIQKLSQHEFFIFEPKDCNLSSWFKFKNVTYLKLTMLYFHNNMETSVNVGRTHVSAIFLRYPGYYSG